MAPARGTARNCHGVEPLSLGSGPPGAVRLRRLALIHLPLQPNPFAARFRLESLSELRLVTLEFDAQPDLVFRAQHC